MLKIKIIMFIVLSICIGYCNEKQIAINDTFVVKNDHFLYSKPQFRDENEKVRLQKYDIVIILNNEPFPDLDDGVQNFYKVKTIKSDTGFVVSWLLISRAQKQAKIDTLKYWKCKAQPSLDSMRGKPCLDGNHVNNEVELTFPWNYLGKNKKYATVSAANNYNLNFWYLLLVSSPDSANIIMDIIPVNLADFPKGTGIEFDHCSRGNESYDTSGIISLLYADPDTYKPGKLLKPFKCWKADLKTKRFIEIPVDDINCRQQDPEEMFNGP